MCQQGGTGEGRALLRVSLCHLWQQICALDAVLNFSRSLLCWGFAAAAAVTVADPATHTGHPFVR